ncbi:MAG: PSD1 domain-containing protein [Rhodobacteraceae bacterium]|nr:PSD1 domain-containing protein [Paracoccaceae bacterium]
MTQRKRYVGAFALILFLLLSPGSVTGDEQQPDFNRDIRPILSGKCFKCHGPDAAAREADLRLDHRDDAVGYGALVPGEPDESSLMERVLSDDPDTQMPPNGDRLTASEVAKLKSWIEGGAKYEKHWSYQRPTTPKRPVVRDESWSNSELDFFILNRIEQAGFTPSPKAEPAVLLRRLYLDLIGLPPSVDEVNAFQADPSQKNYEAQVDQLLKSKHFGEKWATGWLDLARYADSNGYQHDDLRTMWPYRDWVINALNEDMPFDQFTIEQLAGDLLPNPTTQQLVATGFHRNVPANFSGGTKVDEIRANILHDRVATTGAVWLGMTLECAQCHDHKFDAISQREYYQFYAYFNQAIPEVAQKGEDMFRKFFVGGEVASYASDADEQRAEEIRQNIAVQEKLLEEPESKSRTQKLKRVQNRTADAENVIANFEGVKPLAANNTSHEAEVTAVSNVPVGGGKIAVKTVIGKLAGAGGFFGTGFSFPPLDHSSAKVIRFWIKTDIEGRFNFQVHSSKDRVSVFGFSTQGVKPGAWHQITAPIKSFSVPSWAKGAVDWSNITKFQITAFGNGPYNGKYIVIDHVVSLNSIDSATQGESKRASVVKRINELKQQLSRLTAASMVMQDEPKPMDTHLMIRGDYTSPGDRVEMGVLSALHPLDPSLPRNRLGLAKWLVSAQNPITSRVAVNRIWAEIFGQGIVTTLDDFGMQGAAPSHPKLLDWLAVRFVEEGWSVKKLIKTIVMSSTYQQTSTASAELIHKDPKNEFYARGPRFRLSAELVRDSLLTVSGQMSDQVGGKLAYPVQPDGLWKEIFGPLDEPIYPTSTGADRYRRGIYTIWRRGNPYPSMINFDAPDRSRCTTARDRSNSPIQALTLLNDPVYVEMAIAFSKIIESWDGSDRDKVIGAFRRVVARQPNDTEIETLLELYRKRQSWFAVTQVLMNLDETITKS